VIYVKILRPAGDLASGKHFAGDAKVRSDHVPIGIHLIAHLQILMKNE